MSDRVIAPVARAGLSIPDYELLRPIGRGAYGEVWLARNVTGSWVALKIVHRAAFDHERPFEREFEGIKRFEPVSRSDPTQVAILHVGLGDGFFYYVMELADDVTTGGTRLNSQSEIRNSKFEMDHSLLTSAAAYQPKTLKRLLNDRGALPAQECLAIALSLTRALAHLHGHGLVHRDVKPSNVIFVNGQAKLADIGLVTSVDATRSFVGTEGYLPPEGAGTPQADLYSLGKMLYEMSTGCDRKEFPALPPDIATRPDGRALAELNAVVVRACQLDPRERYANAETMHADLELLQAGQSVQRRRSRERIWSHTKKIALVVGAIAATFVLANWFANRETRLTGSTQPSSDFLSSTNELALEEYRKGVRALQVEGDNAQAIQHFKNAIQREPKFAEAWASLAWAHFSYGASDPDPREGPAAAEKAARLNPDLAYAHSMLATARASELNFTEADKERTWALALKPNSQEILLESALNLACMGKTNEALLDLEKARRANPDSASNKRESFYAFVYGWCRQYDKALKIYEQVGSDRPFDNQQRALAALGAGNFTNFIHFSRQALLATAANTNQVNAEFESLEQAFQQGGQPKYWELSLKLESLRRDSDHLMRMATTHAQLNQPDKAFECLRGAMHETRGAFLTGFYTNPSFDRLRNDKRFREIEHQLWREKTTVKEQTR